MARVVDKKTGKVVEVENPSEGLSSGQLELPASEPVRIKDESGQVLEVDPVEDREFLSALARGQAAGYSWATEDESRLAEAGGDGLAAFGQGLARSATFGLSDQLQANISADPEARREELALQREANEGASLAGEITGDVAGAILSGGAGTAGKLGAKAVAKRALSVPGAVTRAAESIGESAAKNLAIRGAGSVGRSATKLAAEGAAEGAVFSLRDASVDAYLSGEDLTGEKALAALGHGVMYGGAAGGVLGGAGSLLGKGAKATYQGARAASGAAFRAVPRGLRESVQDIAGKLGFKAEDGLADEAVRAIDAMGRAEADALQDAAKVAERHGDEAGQIFADIAQSPRARRAIGSPDEVRRESAKVLQENLSSIRKLSDEADEGFARGAAKRKMLEEIPDDAPVDSILERAGELIAEVRTKGEEFAFANKAKFRGSTAGKKLERVSEAYKNAFKKYEAGRLEKSDLAEVYLETEQLKREIGTAVKSLQRSNPLAAQELEAVYMGGFKDFLEDTSSWGLAGERAAAANNAWAARIALDDTDALRGAFTSSGTAPKGFAKEKELKGRVADYFSQDPTASLQKSQDLDKLRRWLDASVEAARTKADAGSETAARNLEQMEAARERVLKAIESAEFAQKARENADRFRSLVSTNNEGRSLGRRVLQQGIASGAGFAVGGPVGGIAGAAGSEVFQQAFRRADDPLGQMLKRFSMAEEGKVAKTLVEQLGDFARPGVLQAQAAIRKTQKAIEGATESVVRAKRGAVKLVSDVNVAAFEERAQRVFDARGNDPAADPHQGAMQASFKRGQGYLRNSLPAGSAPTPYEPGKVRAVGAGDARKWLRLAEAVENPLTVIEQIKDGNVPVQGLQALRDTSPALYEELRSSVMEKAIGLGRRLTPAAKRRIQQLFPEATASTPSPQGPPVQAATPEQAPPRVPPSTRVDIEASDFRTGADSSIERFAS